MSFDYDDSPDVDFSVVTEIATEMSGVGQGSMTDEEREARRIEHQTFLAENYERDRQRRLDYQREQTEKAAAERLESERLAAIAATERRQRLQQEMRKQTERQNRDRTLTSILNHQIEQRQVRQTMLRSYADTAARQRLKSVLYPPEQPAPPPAVELDDEDAARLHRTWFK